MIDKRKENLSKAFAASLSFGFIDKEADYSLNKEDTMIAKYAGLDIYQPTVENVELFIRKYVLNELAFFPKTVNVSIRFLPSAFDSVKKDYVKDGTGVVEVKLHSKKIEFPFIVRDSELVPFDLIQMDGQRVPYSRENLRKVLYGIDKLEIQKQNGGLNSGYAGLEKAVNPSTSPGFLGDTISIREQHIRRKGNDIYVTASKKIDEALEKVASLTPLTQETIKVLENHLRKKAKEQLNEQFQKFAEEDKSLVPTDKEVRLFQKIKDTKFIDANTLPNGTVIMFPERDGKDLVMTKGIVITEYIEPFKGYKTPKAKIVLSSDGRIRILNNSERFLCFKATEQRFETPLKQFSALSENDVFIAFDGNKALYPHVLTYIVERGWDGRKVGAGQANKSINAVKIYRLEPVNYNSSLKSVFDGDSHKINENANPINMVTLNNTKFLTIPYGDFIARKSKEIMVDEITLSSMISKYEVVNRAYSTLPQSHNDDVFVTSEDTKVILVKGIIKDFFRDKSEFEHLERMASLDLDFEEGFEKFAGAENEIRIECVDSYLKLYNVNIRYTDKTKRIFKQMQNKYNRIKQDDLIAILRLLGFDAIKIKEIVFKARNEASVVYPLPPNSNPSKLQGGNLQNITKQNIANTVTRFINPQDLTMAIVSHMIGSSISEALKSGSGPKLDKVINALKKYASESKALSSEFEKIAMSRKSKDALDVAKLMSLNAMLIDKVASTIQEKEIYPRLTEVAEDILSAKDHLEKVATELIALKVEQYDKRNEIINPNYIQSAVNQIDNLYKLAYSVDEANQLKKEAKFGFGNKKQNFNAKRNKEDSFEEVLANEIDDNMDKEAGFGNAVKAVGRTLGGAAIGGAIGLDKAREKNQQNPMIEDGSMNMAAGLASGAVLGGMAAGPGVGLVKKGLKTVFKKAEEEKESAMNVPTEEEAKKESNVEPQNADNKDRIVTETEDSSTRHTPSDEPHLKEDLKQKDDDERTIY